MAPVPQRVFLLSFPFLFPDSCVGKASELSPGAPARLPLAKVEWNILKVSLRCHQMGKQESRVPLSPPKTTAKPVHFLPLPLEAG